MDVEGEGLKVSCLIREREGERMVGASNLLEEECEKEEIRS